MYSGFIESNHVMCSHLCLRDLRDIWWLATLGCGSIGGSRSFCLRIGFLDGRRSCWVGHGEATCGWGSVVLVFIWFCGGKRRRIGIVILGACGDEVEVEWTGDLARELGGVGGLDWDSTMFWLSVEVGFVVTVTAVLDVVLLVRVLTFFLTSEGSFSVISVAGNSSSSTCWLVVSRIDSNSLSKY